jgi:hypothetical protein
MNALAVMFVTVIVFAVALGALIALPVMWLWNGCLVGAINGVNEITYLQAWGLYVMSNLIFKTTVTKSS